MSIARTSHLLERVIVGPILFPQLHKWHIMMVMIVRAGERNEVDAREYVTRMDSSSLHGSEGVTKNSARRKESAAWRSRPRAVHSPR
jgi:hypothetical protein